MFHTVSVYSQINTGCHPAVFISADGVTTKWPSPGLKTTNCKNLILRKVLFSIINVYIGVFLQIYDTKIM
jgi:hypothetical protein